MQEIVDKFPNFVEFFTTNAFKTEVLVAFFNDYFVLVINTSQCDCECVARLL